MRKNLILGAGTGGIIFATMLRKELKKSEWLITIIDWNTRHLHR
jgi:NADH dehydrogenase FAD-containing subunit